MEFLYTLIAKIRANIMFEILECFETFRLYLKHCQSSYVNMINNGLGINRNV